MLRDGVCDETANTAKCLYDGGDCCKENKDKFLCRNCVCMLKIDHGEQLKQFNALEVTPFADAKSLDTAIGNKGWTVEVEDVVSLPVCAQLCLDHEIANELNAWHYRVNERICNCGWVESRSCPEKMVISDWTWKYLENSTVEDNMGYNAFIQLNKTVSCGKYINLQ